uniref:OCRE domain-containing protein n=1 Tax=Amphimedon queenslandica TaxID=400682 RepID=A0A1X7TS04_AMPQE
PNPPVQENESPAASNPEAPPPPPPIGMTGDISSQLAAASDHATQSCGYFFDERTGYYYDRNTGLYYDQ